MPFITTVNEKDANSNLKGLYDKIKDTIGMDKVPNAFQCASINYDLTKWIWNGYTTIMAKDLKISRNLKEKIALIVSNHNSCQYCVQAHSNSLKELGMDEDTINQLKSNQSEKDKEIFDFVLKVTDNADKITQEDHDKLQNTGLSKEQILEIISVAAYFNLLNRIIDSLGTELDL